MEARSTGQQCTVRQYRHSERESALPRCILLPNRVRFQTTQFLCTFRQVSCDVVSVCALRYFYINGMQGANISLNYSQTKFGYILPSFLVNDIKERHTLEYKPYAHESAYTIFIFLNFQNSVSNACRLSKTKRNLLIVPRRYVCGVSVCFMSCCLKFLCSWRLMYVFIFLVKFR